MYPMWGHASSSYMPASCSVGPGSVPGQVDVGFVVNELALRHVSDPDTSGLPCQYHSTSASFFSFIYHRRCVNLVTDSVVV